MSRSLGHTANRVTRLRSYPPVALVVVGIFLTATILPSALNLAQPNPSQTLEYAPVPGSSENPSGGGLSSLGLGSSGSLLGSRQSEFASSDGPPGQGARPSTKRCVGKPPRQTEDPISPPCVAFFEGDNGGATYTGVTRTEVRILVNYPSASPNCGYRDFQDQPPSDDTVYAKSIWGLQRYFNDRYQLYGRRLHLFGFANCLSSDPSSTRANAAEDIAYARPFAVFRRHPFYGDVYREAVAAKGVVEIDSTSPIRLSEFAKYPKLLIGYDASLEKQASLFSTYICKKVIGHRVSFSGNALDDQGERKLGLYYMEDQTQAFSALFAQRVRTEVAEECGGRFTLELSYPNPVFSSDLGSSEAAQDWVSFRQAGVTTVIWPNASEYWSMTHSMGAQRYYPEIVMAALGEGVADSALVGQISDPGIMAHAFIVSGTTLSRGYRRDQCGLAVLEVNSSSTDEEIFAACILYSRLRQLVIGIQVAGPRLTPATMDAGFRAIPALPSPNPATPACFYDPGDYTCVKDAVAEWWEATGRQPTNGITGGSEGGGSGCWRMVENGKRYLVGTWPAGDVIEQRRSNDICNGNP